MVHSTAATAGAPRNPQGPESADVSARPYTRQALNLLDYRWSRRQPGHRHSGLQHLLDPAHALSEMPLTYQTDQPRPADLPELSGLYTQHLTPCMDMQEAASGALPSPLPTLEDSVIDGLIRALYAALPDALSQTEAERTASGNTVGRHGYAPRITPVEHWLPVSVPARPAELQDHEAEEGDELTEPLAAPEPRPYVLGAVPEGLQLVTLRSLTDLHVHGPADTSAAQLSARQVLGTGEPCYLRAQAALWSWRTHRQVNMDLHTHGPPRPGRDALIEQKIGPVTLLLGCRVTHMTEEPRRWGFTLTSLNGQVLVCREDFLVEWHDDGTVVFNVSMQQQLAMPSLTFLGAVHAALSRKFKQGYVRNMLELTSD